MLHCPTPYCGHRQSVFAGPGLTGSGFTRKERLAMKHAFWFCSIALIFGLGALRPQAASAQQADEGKVTFDKMCAACHGKTGAGNGPAAAGLKTKPISFRDSKFQAGVTDDSLKTFITKGKPPMPGFAKLTPAQLTAVVTYIRQLGQPPKKS
ncbi:MAG: cytochrome c [Gemmatimonadetes bacterium]|nr:cytochrome c [Gemmatimonadota bacterium]